MIKKTIEVIKQRIGNKNVKTYLFFVAFTTFLWLALQFSKNYSQEVTFGIKYKNVEKEKLLAPKTDKEIKMVLEGNGFQLLKYSLFKKIVELDVQQASKISKKHVFFTGNSMLNIIKSSLEYTGEIAYSLNDSLNIYYDVFETKELPLVIKSDIEYKPGFISIKGVTSSLSKVTVIGPKSVLDTLKNINSETLSLKNIHNNYEGNIGFYNYEKDLKLSFDQKNIPIQLSVSKLTEGEFNVPIKVNNIPNKAKVNLFPKQVKVVFSVPLQDYNKLSGKDFKVTADLNSATDDNNLILKLEKWPSTTFNARLLERKVQYILVK